jgi:hypothetical protein
LLAKVAIKPLKLGSFTKPVLAIFELARMYLLDLQNSRGSTGA